jgi:hypothetical protein
MIEVTTALEFAKAIEEIVWDKDCSYFDAIILYMEVHGIEAEMVASYLKANVALKEILSEECENLNLIEKTKKLFYEEKNDKRKPV